MTDRAVLPAEFTRAATGVVALCFVLNTLARGNGETFAVFYGPLLDDLGWGRAATASLYSAFMISIAATGPLIGAAFDRIGGRIVYVGGLLAYGTGFLIASQMTALWQGWLGLGLLGGLGATATGMTPATGLIARWFDRNMGLAVAIAYSGFAVGALILAPLSGWLIGEGGWRWTYQVLGVALLTLALATMLLPWRAIGRGIKPPAKPRPFLPDRAVFLKLPFWGLFGVFFLTATTTYIVQVPAVVYLEEAGYGRTAATWIYGVNSMMSVIGIIGAGALVDRFGQRAVATLAYSMSIAGILALMALAAGPHPIWLGLFMLCFGGAMGSRGPVVS